MTNCVCTIDSRDGTVFDREWECNTHGIRRWCRTCGTVTVGWHNDHLPFAERVKGVNVDTKPLHPNDPYRK